MKSKGVKGNALFYLALPPIVSAALAGILAPDSLAKGAQSFSQFWFGIGDWFFMLSVSFMLCLGLWLAFSRFGHIRLGKDNEEPEFGRASWLSMLFAAGMGTGILFWGVAEPLTHYAGAPGISEPGPAAARQAMVITAFHWGLHAWAVYALAALVLAYFCFRRGKAYLPGEPIRSEFSGRWVSIVAGMADLTAVLAIVFGVAGAMSMGTMQMQKGLSIVLGTSADSSSVSIVILVALTIAYMASAATKLDKGIKWLSNINMLLAILLGSFLLLMGPTDFILRSFITSIGDYLSQLPSMSLNLYPGNAEEVNWMHSWSLTYFIWWIAWAPFVGVFIARISRGRTIKEFVLGVMFVPTGFTMLWFAILGGSGLYLELNGDAGVGALVSSDVALALFALYEHFPFSDLLAGISVLLIFIFLVTSVDSATFVLGMLTSGGSMDPPRKRKLVWGIGLGVLGAATVLSRSVEGAKAIAVLGAIPFTFVLLLQIAAFLKAAVFDDKESTEES